MIDYSVSQVMEVRSFTETTQADYRIFMVDPVDVKLITIGVPDNLGRSSDMPEWYVPKTARGRRMMELRRLAKEAGEEFLPPEQIIAEIRKLRE